MPQAKKPVKSINRPTAPSLLFKLFKKQVSRGIFKMNYDLCPSLQYPELQFNDSDDDKHDLGSFTNLTLTSTPELNVDGRKPICQSIKDFPINQSVKEFLEALTKTREYESKFEDVVVLEQESRRNGYEKSFKDAIDDIKGLQAEKQQIPVSYLLSLYMYSGIECYSQINEALREDKLEPLMRFSTILRCLRKGLKMLSLYSGTCYRGIVMNPEEYRLGNIVTWAGFTSASEKRKRALSFVSKKKCVNSKKPTLFIIVDSQSGRCLHECARFPEEKEILFDIYATFQVLGIEVKDVKFEKELIEDVYHITLTEIKQTQKHQTYFTKKYGTIDFKNSTQTACHNNMRNHNGFWIKILKLEDGQKEYHFLLNNFKNCLKICKAIEIFWLEKDLCGLVFRSYPSNLKKQIQEAQETFSETQIINWLEELVEGLQVIHHANLIHGHLQPSNFFLDEESRLFIGNLHYSVEKITPLNGWTSGYFAPEVIQTRQFSPSSDMYSVGSFILDLFTLTLTETSQDINKKERMQSIPTQYNQKWVAIVESLFKEDLQTRMTLQQFTIALQGIKSEVIKLNKKKEWDKAVYENKLLANNNSTQVEDEDGQNLKIKNIAAIFGFGSEMKNMTSICKGTLASTFEIETSRTNAKSFAAAKRLITNVKKQTQFHPEMQDDDLIALCLLTFPLFFKELSVVLQDYQNQDVTAPVLNYGNFLSCFTHGFSLLPCYSGVAYQGAIIQPDDYKVGNKVIWQGITITCRLQNAALCNVDLTKLNPSEGKQLTLFEIDSKSGRDFTIVSLFPEEEEIVFGPYTCFIIKEIQPTTLNWVTEEGEENLISNAYLIKLCEVNANFIQA